MTKKIAIVLTALLSCAAPTMAQQAAKSAPPRLPDVPYVPTSPEVVDAMLKLAQVSERDVVYDLGCGDGRIVIAAIKRGAKRGVCVDINPQRIAEAKAAAAEAGVANRIQFLTQDLFATDLSDATVVTLYLLTSVNLKLRPKLLAELDPGTRVVSHAFDMGDWTPQKKVEAGGTEVYFWTIPSRSGSRRAADAGLGTAGPKPGVPAATTR